jgi:hypothetical protein
MSTAASWTISAVRDALRTKEISARELTKDFFARIENRNRELNAFLSLSIDRAYAQADRIDAMIANGDALPPLAGVPIAVKDVISTRGVTTTCGSKILETYVPPYDATAVERLESAGAVILGKTNCDEFAMGSSNENSAYGPVRNPVALRRRCSRRLGRGSVGNRHRGLDSAARCLLRRPRYDANIRTRIQIRAYSLRLVAGSHRSTDTKCYRRCRIDVHNGRS